MNDKPTKSVVREIPPEIARNIERRRRKAEREEFGASLIEAFLYVLILVSYFLLMRLFIKQ